MRKEAYQIGARRGLSTFDLKCIAVFSMLVDHIGAFLNPSELWMRYVGRLAFPIYCFLIVEGYFHTHDVRKYMGRLFLFALLSEIPYDLARYDTALYPDSQNVYFTLFFGLLCVYAFAELKHIFLTGGVLITVGVLTYFVVKPDYDIGGIAMILCFYLFRSCPWERFLSVGAINICYEGDIQAAAILALIPVHLYNGKKGPSVKYFFYAFYPVHLFALYLIRRYLFNVN